MPASISKTVVESSFSRGIVRDLPRNAIPPGGAYDILDFFVDRPGVAYKRGGSSFQSGELVDEVVVVAVAAPEYPGDPRVIAIGSDGADRTLYDVTGSSPEPGIDVNGAQPTENPPTVFLSDTIGAAMILCDGLDTEDDGYYQPQKVYLSGGNVAVADLGGTPPNARYSCFHLSYLVLANGTAGGEEHQNRLWFSPVPDMEDTWDVDNAYIDVNGAITGLASVQGVLIVFTRGTCMRVLGSVPPGTTGEDMELQPLGGVGCIDARSIVQMNNLVYFANEHGVYFTNGSGFESITEKSDSTGISQLWSEAIAGFAPALGAVVCCGVWLNTFLFVTIRQVDETTHQFLYFDTRQSWVRLGDSVAATMYATRFAPNGEIYAGCANLTSPVRLLKLSGMFDPGSGNIIDADETPIEGLIETRTLGDGPGLKHYEFSHTTHDVYGFPTIYLNASSADNDGVDSFVYKTIDTNGTGINEVYLSCTFYVSEAQIAELPDLGDSAFFFEVADLYGAAGLTPIVPPSDYTNAFLYQEGLGLEWDGTKPVWRSGQFGELTASPAVEAGTHTVSLHLKCSTDTFVYVIDGNTYDMSSLGYLPGRIDQIDAILFGSIGGGSAQDTLSYFIKVGTTNGGGQIIPAADFPDALDLWDGTVGKITVQSVPGLRVREAVGIEAQTFKAVQEGASISADTDAKRSRQMLARESHALSLRYNLLGFPQTATLNTVEVDYRVEPLEEDGQ